MNNSITLVGYVGQNPSLTSFKDSGNRVVRFSIAVKEYSSNTEEQKTMWIDINAWNGLADRAMKTITKGREVVVYGRLALSTFTKKIDGKEIQMTKPAVKLTSFHLCGRKPQSESQDEELGSDETEVLSAVNE